MIEVAVAFALTLATGLTIYWLGGTIAPKSKPTVNKLMAYACGERFTGTKFQINAEEFYIYSVYFLIFDILAFIVATSMGLAGMLPVLYLLVVLAALAPLFGRHD